MSRRSVPSVIEIRTLSEGDIGRCRDILYSLPAWFGLEDSNQAYVRSLSELPGAVACRGERIVGFIALAEHTPNSFEIHVMAVEPAFHRQGAGKALIDWAESWCGVRGGRWLHVKTRGPSTPDPEYARTRAFYSACGFEPLFETLELWGPENAALIMVKSLDPAEPAA
jgi:GNAT superfamily N-acetyltransferase